LPGSGGIEGVAQIIYKYVSKCKNDKIKGEKKMSKRKKQKNNTLLYIFQHAQIFFLIF
jgi:hypothetical protein